MPFETDVLGRKGTFCDVELLFFPWLDTIWILPVLGRPRGETAPLCHAQGRPQIVAEPGFSTLPTPDPESGCRTDTRVQLTSSGPPEWRGSSTDPLIPSAMRCFLL